ncbi:MAG: multi-sensor hybrid histidine kinase [Myxococcales bacterium]|nr:multi-sensor hybrid histidine kinase [Myxococcales bacterium]
MSEASAIGRSVGPELRAQIRRGADRVAFVGGTLATAIQTVALGRDQAPAAMLLSFAVAVCGGIGWRTRASWTPYAYLVLLTVANVIALMTFGLLLGIGAVYLLMIALSFMFTSPRVRGLVVVVLVSSPIAVGALIDQGLIEPPPMFDLDSSAAWGRMIPTAVAAMVGIAVVIGYAVRHLIAARLDIEVALQNERELRRTREAIDEQIARSERSDLIVEIAAEVGANIGAALEIVASRAEALTRELDEEARECLADVVAATTAARSTMRSLTVFAPGASDVDASCDAVTTARALPAMVRRTIPRRIALELAIDHDGEARIPLSANDLLRVLSNLVLNARDAIAGDGTITVRIGRGSGCVMIDVTDDGCGMDEETRSRLFQPFFTTKPIGRGTGLGLATTKILVERAGGEIELTTAPGAGAHFTIRLPQLP